jgi:RecB family exonuclease
MIGGIARYLADLASEGAELVGGETTFEFPVGRALATGTIDRVERDRGGRVRVIDLKTGSSRPSAKETATHAQLGVYQLAVRAGVVEGVAPDAPTGGAALLYVRQKTRDPYTLLTQPPLDEEAATTFQDRLTAAAEGMAAARFPGPVEPDVRFGSSPYRPMLLRVPDVSGG